MTIFQFFPHIAFMMYSFPLIRLISFLTDQNNGIHSTPWKWVLQLCDVGENPLFSLFLSCYLVTKNLEQ